MLDSYITTNNAKEARRLANALYVLMGGEEWEVHKNEAGCEVFCGSTKHSLEYAKFSRENPELQIRFKERTNTSGTEPHSKRYILMEGYNLEAILDLANQKLSAQGNHDTVDSIRRRAPNVTGILKSRLLMKRELSLSFPEVCWDVEATENSFKITGTGPSRDNYHLQVLNVLKTCGVTIEADHRYDAPDGTPHYNYTISDFKRGSAHHLQRIMRPQTLPISSVSKHTGILQLPLFVQKTEVIKG